MKYITSLTSFHNHGAQKVVYILFRIIFLFLFAEILYFPASSQDLEIKARIIDTFSFEPVAFSTIYLNEFSGTITDELGFFRLQVSPDAYFDKDSCSRRTLL
jgi:hypothetical protein